MNTSLASNFKPMLAKDGDLNKIKFPQMAQPKLDGIRASVVNGRLVSRTLKLIPNEEIQDALARPEFEGLDGELIVGDPRDPECYRNTASFVMSESKTGQVWTYFVFDKWDHGGPCRERVAAVEALTAPAIWHRVQAVATSVVNSLDDLDAMEALLLTEGYEGVILRDPDARYKFGRSGKTGPLLKVKRFVDFEAEVIGVYEEMHNANEAKTNELGRTERSSAKDGKVGKGTLGGLIVVAINGPAEGVEFRCGTGFTAAMRADLWTQAGTATNRRGLDGQVAKIKSFPIGVKDKPRHPVFLGWRDMAVDG